MGRKYVKYTQEFREAAFLRPMEVEAIFRDVGLGNRKTAFLLLVE
jgi:hypothetical protein